MEPVESQRKLPIPHLLTPIFHFALGRLKYAAGSGHELAFLGRSLYISIHLTLGVIWSWLWQLGCPEEHLCINKSPESG